MSSDAKYAKSVPEGRTNHTVIRKESAEGGSWMRKLATVLLGGAVCLTVGAYVIVHWVEHQILHTDNRVAMVTPLPKQPAVSSALAAYVSDQVFSVVSVKHTIADVLPPKATFLAEPLTGQLQSSTTRAAQKVVTSDSFQALWSAANRLAMNRLVAQARGQTPPLQARLNQKFTIDISSVRAQLRTRLGDVGNVVPALQPACEKVITVSADLQARPRRVQQTIRGIDYLAAVLPWAGAASLLGLLAVSKHRRKTLLGVVAALGIVLLLELIAIKFLHHQVLGTVHDSAHAGVVSYLYDTFTESLRHTIYGGMAALVLLAGVVLLAGPATWARNCRSLVRADRLQHTAVLQGWHTVRRWVGRREYWLWLAVAVLVLVLVAISKTVNTQLLLHALLAMVGLFAGVHIVATPPQDHPVTR